MKKDIAILLKIFGVMLFVAILGGCNFCPNNPDNSNYQDELLISYNSQSGKSILVLSNINNFSFQEIISDISVHSSLADNGDFCYIQKNYKNYSSALFMGNVFSKTQKLLEIENQIFLIINPVISPKSNAIAFSGGKGQLYIWISNPTTKATYIDKITNNFLEKSIPVFTNNGKYLCFLEQSPNELKLSVVDIQKPDEVILEHIFHGQTQIFGQDTRLSITDMNKVFFIANDENNFFLNLIDINANKATKYALPKNALQITTGEISRDGKTALLISNDGVIWATKFYGTKLKTYQLTNFDECFRYIDIRWKKDDKMFIAFRINCQNAMSNSKKLYLFKIENNNDDIKVTNKTYYSSNVVDAYWR